MRYKDRSLGLTEIHLNNKHQSGQIDIETPSLKKEGREKERRKTVKSGQIQKTPHPKKIENEKKKEESRKHKQTDFTPQYHTSTLIHTTHSMNMKTNALSLSSPNTHTHTLLTLC